MSNGQFRNFANVRAFFEHVHPGDKVEVTTKAGNVYQFFITQYSGLREDAKSFKYWVNASLSIRFEAIESFRVLYRKPQKRTLYIGSVIVPEDLPKLPLGTMLVSQNYYHATSDENYSSPTMTWVTMGADSKIWRNLANTSYTHRTFSGPMIIISFGYPDKTEVEIDV